MRISLIAVHELDAGALQRWRAIQDGNPALSSPYYCAEFTQAVGAAGQSVRVAVIESGGQVLGYFPHERDAWGVLRPVGRGLNDYHGIIGVPELVVDPQALLAACGGRYYGFNHMPLSQGSFAAHVRVAHASPVMDLTDGWEAYVQRLARAQNKSTPGILSAIRYSSKRLEKALGPLRFERYTTDASVLETVMRLKSEQRARTVGSVGDPFALPWVQRLLPALAARTSTAFRGESCALYAGDTLVACHFGLRAQAVLHYWFPVYEPAHAAFQPGLIMLKLLAEQGLAHGLALIDLGRGTQDYKMRFCTSQVALGEGAVSRPMLLAAAHMQSLQLKKQLKADPRVQRWRAWWRARSSEAGAGQAS